MKEGWARPIVTILFKEEIAELRNVIDKAATAWRVGREMNWPLNDIRTKFLEVSLFKGHSYLGISEQDPVTYKRVPGRGFNFLNNEFDKFILKLEEICETCDLVPTESATCCNINMTSPEKSPICESIVGKTFWEWSL